MKRRQKFACDLDTLHRLASTLLDEHETLTRRGFNLTGASGLTMDSQGAVTARFVYRTKRDTVAVTLRGLTVVWQ